MLTEPGQARSGIVYGGKVYETDGANPVGVRDWEDIRLLAPVSRPPTVRLFAHNPDLPTWERDPAPEFLYINPGNIRATQEPVPGPASPLHVTPCLAVVLAGSGSNVPVDVADDLVLGFGLSLVFSNSAAEFPARAYDVGFNLGPALTTPDELESLGEASARGRTYELTFSLSRNGEPTETLELSAGSATVAESLSSASLTAPLRVGELFLFALSAPLACAEPGDVLELRGDPLGTLATRVL